MLNSTTLLEDQGSRGSLHDSVGSTQIILPSFQGSRSHLEYNPSHIQSSNSAPKGGSSPSRHHPAGLPTSGHIPDDVSSGFTVASRDFIASYVILEPLFLSFLSPTGTPEGSVWTLSVLVDCGEQRTASMRSIPCKQQDGKYIFSVSSALLW